MWKLPNQNKIRPWLLVIRICGQSLIFHILYLSGRDSVEAKKCGVKTEVPQERISKEDEEKDVMRRIEEQFKKVDGDYDLKELRAAFQEKDIDKAGKLHPEMVRTKLLSW